MAQVTSLQVQVAVTARSQCCKAGDGGAAPVEVPDAVRLQLGARDGVAGPEVAQQAQRAVAGDLPDAEEAQDVVNAVRVEETAAQCMVST